MILYYWLVKIVKLNKLFNQIKEIRVGDIVINKKIIPGTGCKPEKYKYCKVTEIRKDLDSHIMYFGYWYQTLDDLKNDRKLAHGTLFQYSENLKRVI